MSRHRRSTSPVLSVGRGGRGGDFIVFNGRGHQTDLLRRGRLGAWWRSVRMRRQVMGGPWRNHIVVDSLGPLLPGALSGLARHPNRTKRGRQAPPALDLLAPDFRARIKRAPRVDDAGGGAVPGVHATQLELWNLGHVPARTESWADHGRELGIDYTFPLLDRRLIEFALALPPQAFLNHGWKRWLYREAMEGILSDEVRWHRFKRDPAMAMQGSHLRDDVSELMEARLVERRGNPYVDVDGLVAHKRRRREGTLARAAEGVAVHGLEPLAFLDPAFAP